MNQRRWKKGTKNVVILPRNKTITVLVPLLMPARTGHQFRHSNDFLKSILKWFLRHCEIPMHRSYNDRARTKSRSTNASLFLLLLLLRICVYRERKRKWIKAMNEGWVGKRRNEMNAKRSVKVRWIMVNLWSLIL